jgi:hypothetical protein
MAKGKKTGGRDFLPGKPPGPGRPRTPYELQEAKHLTKTLFDQHVTRLTKMSVAELNVYVKDPKCTSLEAMIVGQIRAAVNGKTTPIGFLLDRTIGPVKQQMTVEVEDSISNRLADMTDDQKMRLIEEVGIEFKKP